MPRDVDETVPSTAPEATVVTDMAALLGGHPREIGPQALIADRYRVEAVLGTGGMAHVVRATDLVLDREVAVKLLRETTDSEADLARFLAETRTLARLSHPGLVTVLDGGTTTSGRPYLVLELVDGPALSASLDTPMDPTRAAQIGTQVAAALAYAHTQGVVHRDVKPGNVLLRGDGRVKLADFGIAKLLGDQSRHTQTGVVVGSVHYLAPEQVAFEEITPAVDVYALGLLLLRALTGHHAFDGTTVETALARLSVAPAVPDELPPGWRDLLITMTARDPGSRPTAAEVAGRLAWLSGAGAPARILPPAASRRPEARDPRGSAPLAAARGRLAAPGHRIAVSPVAVGAVLLAVLLFVASCHGGQRCRLRGADRRPVGLAVRAGDAAPAGRAETETDSVVAVAEVSPPTVSTSTASTQQKAEAAKPGKGKNKAKHKPDKHENKGKGKGKDKSKDKPGKGKDRPGKG